MSRHIVTLSKPYVAAAYRRKFAMLAGDKDLRVTLLCPPAWGAQKFEPDPEYDRLYDLRVIPVRLNGKNHFHWYPGLKRLFAELKPDVLNIEEEHYSFVTWQALKARPSESTKFLFYTWQNIYKNYPWPFSAIEQTVFMNAAAGVCGNHEAADILKQKGYPGPTPEILQMGVETDHIRPATPDERKAARAKLGIADDKVVIGFLGRIVAEKGLDDLLDALVLLPSSANIQVVIVGDGPLRAALSERVNQLDLRDRVLMLGSVSSREVSGILHALDAHCLPSRTETNWKEQYGRILAEAMAAGVPALGSNSGAIPEVIGDASLVFKERDPKNLAECLVDFARRQDKDELRLKVRNRAERLFSADAVTAQWRDLFLSV